ncbi:MAG: ATP synthase F1 subunit delta [Acholeplasmataceae bacterium]
MNSYVKALYDVAVANHSLDEITYQFDQLNEAVMSQKKWLEVMNSPMLSNNDKSKKIDDLNLNKDLANVLKILAHTRQMEVYDEIYPEWVRLMREINHVAHINIYTVKPLSDKQINALTKKLKPRFKKQQIEIHVKVRDNLIGGIRMVYQGQSLDHSIAHELEELFMTL